jgi:hypothetical protein
MSYAKISRKEANFRDKQRASWFKESDGVNRASIRKEMAQSPRAVRIFKRSQMEHRQMIAALKTTGLPVAGDHKTNNRLKTKRRARR